MLQHRDFVLLFHELGHGIHELVALTKFACFHGTASPEDFAEAPSQMLENWCWTPTQLRRLGRHYSYLSPENFEAWKEIADGKPRPPEKLPDVAIASLARSKHVNSALMYLGQLSISTFDMKMHELNGYTESEAWDIAMKWNQLRHQIVPMAGGEAVHGQDNWKWGHGYADFRHFIDNYEAGYYSYML